MIADPHVINEELRAKGKSIDAANANSTLNAKQAKQIAAKPRSVKSELSQLERDLKYIYQIMLLVFNDSGIPQDPPSAAIFLLLLAPKKNRDPLLGDLEEEYRTIVLPKVGLRRARLWFWWQVLISLAPLISQQLKRIVGLGLLWKYIGR